MVEGGVKTRDLRQIRVKICDGRDGGKIMGLMKRRQRNELTQLVNHRGIDTYRRSIDRSTMDDAMPGRDQAIVGNWRFHPIQKRGERVLMSGRFSQILIDQRCSRAVLCDEMHAMSDAVEFAVADIVLWAPVVHAPQTPRI